MTAIYTIRGRQVTVARAPKGGLDFGGRRYRGGQFCPLAAAVTAIAGGAPETVAVALSHVRDTWGNYGQHAQHTDYVSQGGGFVRCDSADGATIDDQSGHSRKNEHTKVLVEVELPVGTLGYTWHSEASSSRGSTGRDYWRVAEDGSKAELDHTTVTVNEGRVARTYHDLADGTRLLVSRAPLGVRTNGDPGTCSCGKEVAAGCGELYRDAAGRWAARCVDCFEATAE